MEPSSSIDLHAMQHELSLVVHQRLLHQGFDYNARVTCDPTGTALTYTCNVLVTNPPPKHRVEWNEAVVCRTQPLPGVPRCSSSSGEALQ